jgi:flagellar hook assembly protein FlgD
MVVGAPLVTETAIQQGRAYIIGPLSTTVSGAEAVTPTALTLGQNYPNPFNPSTTIAFDLPQRGELQLEVFDVRGRVVRTLMSGVQTQGPHTVHWDGRDDNGRGVASGVYFYRLTTPSGTQTRKMHLVR